MSGRKWLYSVIVWDGGLPLLVAASPALLPAILPRRDLAELTAVILVPIIAALIRAHHGRRQLEDRGIQATLGRQFLFGCAVAALLLFEGFSGILHCARGVPPSAWLTAGTIYLVYLCLVVPALRPRQLAVPWAGSRGVRTGGPRRDSTSSSTACRRSVSGLSSPTMP